MTVVDDLGAAVAPVTEWHKFPLPFPDPNRYEPEFDHYSRYKVLHPLTGVRSAMSRVGTGARAIEDNFTLTQWQIRNVVEGFGKNPDLLIRAQAAVRERAQNEYDDKRFKAELTYISELAQFEAGAFFGREFGTAVHAWCEALDRGSILLPQVPEQFRAHCQSYLTMLAVRGITILPDWTERVIWHEETDFVGTFDRLVLLSDGTYCICDMKTGKDLKLAALSMKMQLATYAAARKVMRADGTRWDDMPEVRQDFGIIFHVPVELAGGGATAVTLDLVEGRKAIGLSVGVRAARKEYGQLGGHVIPWQTDPLITRELELRVNIQTCKTPIELGALWEANQDVWNDMHTELGHAVLASVAA